MLSALECILDKFERHGDKDAIVYKDTTYSYKGEMKNDTI